MVPGTTSQSRRTLGWAGVTVAGVVAGYLSVLLANPRHFYTDDTEAQYGPMWVMLGRHLHEGRFPALVPWEWMSGNYSMEEAGLYNPPQLVVDWFAPMVDNLAVYVTVVKLIFSIVAALGVFRVCLAYGARAPWAAVAAVGFPLSGWFLFFDESSWATSLTGTAWMLHAWAAAVRYLQQQELPPEQRRWRNGPVPLFVFLYLAISVQYVFPAVESGIMIFAVAVGDVIVRRRWAPALRLIAVTACAGLAGLETYLPGILSSPVTWRGNETVIADNFLTVPWSESLNASLPSTRPGFTGWWGYVQPIPMVYIAWFVIPMLAFVNWRAVRSAWRELSGLGLFTLMFLFWTAGPGRIGPLRWPARVLPMLAVGVLVGVCLLLSRFGAFADWRRRWAAAGTLIGLLLIRSFSSAPHLVVAHVVSAVVVAAATAVVVALIRTRGVALGCVLAILVMFPIAYEQVRDQGATPLSYGFAEKRSTIASDFPDFRGVTLQLADRALVAPQDQRPDRAWGSLAFGNYAKNTGLHYINAYTPIGFRKFSKLLCMGWDGSTCPIAFHTAFSIDPQTGRTYVDLMKVDRVVLQRAQFPDAGTHPAPPGWKWVDYPGHEQYIWVLEREDGPISTSNGLVSDTHNVTAASVFYDSVTSQVRVSSATGGSIVFARLPWPGYRATLDGHELPIRAVAGTFLAVDVPAGTHNADLILEWRPPGWIVGIAGAVAGVLGIAVLQWFYRRRPKSAVGAEPDDREPDADDSLRDTTGIAVHS